MTNMSKILWEGHALSTDPTFPRAYEASILNPLHYKFLATPLAVSDINEIYDMMKFIRLTGSTDSTDKQTDWQTDTNTINAATRC